MNLQTEKKCEPRYVFPACCKLQIRLTQLPVSSSLIDIKREILACCITINSPFLLQEAHTILSINNEVQL